MKYEHIIILFGLKSQWVLTLWVPTDPNLDHVYAYYGFRNVKKYEQYTSRYDDLFF